MVCQASLKELRTDPLRPAIILWVARVDLAAPIDTRANAAKLSSKVSNIGRGRLLRRFARLDGVILCRETKAIPAHRVEHLVTKAAPEARHCIDNRMLHKVPCVHPCSTWVREHAGHIILWFGRGVIRPVALVFCPVLLPFWLDFCRIVSFHIFHILP